jgi:hypothetical protein
VSYAELVSTATHENNAMLVGMRCCFLEEVLAAAISTQSHFRHPILLKVLPHAVNMLTVILFEYPQGVQILHREVAQKHHLFTKNEWANE